MKKAMIILGGYLLGSIAYAIQINQPTLIVTGDSITRRTPCGGYEGSYDRCDAAGIIEHEHSYATYLNAVTKYQIVPTDNSARGGDTCTTQQAFEAGVWVGQARGILAQVNTRVNNRIGDHVSILLGINDMNSFHVNATTLKICLKELYNQVSSSGKKVLAMTYPPINPSTTLWQVYGTSGVAAAANVNTVNSVVRQAVNEHNATFPQSRVLLLETSSAWDAGSASAFTLADGVHPNAAGAKTMARTWYDLACRSGQIACSPWSL